MCCCCEIGGDSQLSYSTECNLLSDVVEIDMLSYSPETGCRCSSQVSYTRSKDRKYADGCVFTTLNLLQSFGFSEIFFLLALAAVCVSPCTGAGNCSNYNVKCQHGKCVEGRLPVNRTLTAFCLCDDNWSGPACDVYSCSGRTL